MMKLYYTPTSAFVRKVLAVAHERSLVDRIELVTLRPSPLKADAELSRTNPLNKIPALCLEDGTVLYDSPVICEYLDALDGAPRLVPAAGPERWRVLRLQALADGVIDAGVLVYYERSQRPPEYLFQPWVDGQLQKVRQGLDALDAECARFAPGTVDLAQIATGACVAWLAFRNVLEPLEGRAQLARWYDAFQARPSMRATAPRAS
jgi:glutathione S-transferase